ncbi:site-specific integrase [Methylobacterium sp. PvR107]|uniref:tyrosine-type recombinase/integrase n=1 Tax=Methylobacterium sp. PvR107 TaxID=2806597 RepID=UPI001AE64D5B|nr:site-specific integrase [Methylobacterium sp. PvR107]MBP1182160.1 integrase [Methylobacterium sp. PvR107]
MATIRKRNGRFQAQVRIKANVPLSKTFDSKAEALRWARSIEVAIDRGDFPNLINERRHVSLGHILERYQAEITPGKKWSSREVSIIKTVRNSSLWHTLIEDLTEHKAAEYRNIRRRSVAPATIVRELALLSHSLEVARREWGYAIRSNCFKIVKKPVIRNGRERRLTDTERTKIFGTPHHEKAMYVVRLAEFSLETAVRKGEMLNIRKRDVNFENCTLRIPETKNGHPRTIPLSPRAMEILRHYISCSEREFVFAINYWTLSARWDGMKEILSIQNLRWHDFRHEAISLFFENGLTIPEVALISGHRDTKLLARYTHLKPENVAEKLARLSAQSQ